MKHVVSVSLGSAGRDFELVEELAGQRVLIQRIGTNGDLRQAAKLLRELDGKVTAIGLGGVNIYLRAGDRRYQLRDGMRLAREVRQTPLVDGSGIKDAVEKELVSWVQERLGWPRPGQVALVVSALDRWALAEALQSAGCRLLIGDAIFGLGIPCPFYSLQSFYLASRAFLPILRHLPIRYLYPLGHKQEVVKPRFVRYYQKADIIAGDFHFLRYRMPEDLSGKCIITSTVTKADVAELKKRGVAWLVTAGPSLEGRSYGSNVLEAICVALLGKEAGFDQAAYPAFLREISWGPRLEKLN